MYKRQEENMAIPMELDGRKVEKAQMDDMLLRLGLTERLSLIHI